ncbi:Protein of unknown function [Cotesia congregata]|uniref:Uncharacterized protein n=1 Tax=Cotesia congregata TaxID=51543 RepID=A0A8J2H796_COTCN|nr:Protein of unknown function [Cotesia congregata]
MNHLIIRAFTDVFMITMFSVKVLISSFVVGVVVLLTSVSVVGVLVVVSSGVTVLIESSFVDLIDVVESIITSSVRAWGISMVLIIISPTELVFKAETMGSPTGVTVSSGIMVSVSVMMVAFNVLGDPVIISLETFLDVPADSNGLPRA